MKTLTLNDITFPVYKSPIYTQLKKEEGFKKVSGKTAMINSNNNEIISVVSNGYEIITNKEAFDYGEKSFRTLFKTDKDENIEVFNIISPDTKSFCHIDLISKKKKVDLLGNEFFPFLRITNSYNAMYRLYFRIGICRGICKNGMIFGEEAIKLGYIHSRGAKEKLKIEIKPGIIDNILDKFKLNIEILQKNSCKDEFKFPIFLKALGIDPAKKTKKEDDPLRIENIKPQFDKKLLIYEKELDNNLYALYNVITDFASFGFEEEGMITTRFHSRQTRAGVWLSEISGLLEEGNMDYVQYLKDYLEISKN